MFDIRHWITLMETWAANPLDDPNFRKWFGNSVIKDSAGKPLRVYHGTYANFDAFSNKETSTGMIFFAVDPAFASGYAAVRSGGGGRVIPCYLRIEKLYDFRTQRGQDIASSFWSYHSGRFDPWSCEQIRIALYGKADVEDGDNPDIHDRPLSHDEWMTAIRRGEYPALECMDFIDWIKNRLKFDGMVMIEGDSVNYAVFSPHQIKSAVSNTGHFNRRSRKLGEQTLELPTIEVGDTVMVGKWKNRKAEITDFTTDPHNQPVLKTTKGDQKLFKPRIAKLMDAENLRYWLALCEGIEPFFSELVANCLAIGYWYGGAFMRPHQSADLHRTIEAFRLAAPLYRFTGAQRLWRAVPATSINGDRAMPNKVLQSWAQTPGGAQSFYGSEMASRVTEPYVLIEAEIDGRLIVFSDSHLKRLITRLEAMDTASAHRAWNILEGRVQPHSYQHEAVVLFPRLTPVKLAAAPLRFGFSGDVGDP